MVSKGHDATARNYGDKTARDESLNGPSEGDGVDEVQLLKLAEGVDSTDDGVVAFEVLCELGCGFGDIYNGDLERAVFESLDLGFVDG
jgi:hypothetical protein